MIKLLPRPCLGVIACFIAVIYLRSSTAHKKHSINGLLVEDQRTHLTKQNYVMQRDVNNIDGNLGVAYAVQAYAPDNGADQLPALIVDYANMIRNDIILLDNSVETRTRKRGNLKVEKQNQAISDLPCSCQYHQPTELDLGDDTYPRYIKTAVCDDKLCKPLYACHKHLYNITVLHRRQSLYDKSDPELPEELRHHWTAKQEPVTVACSCVPDYAEQN